MCKGLRALSCSSRKIVGRVDAPSAVPAAARCAALAVLLAAFAGLPTARGQDSRPAFPYEGEITGDDVYVRCGPGSNYYPTTKLHSGDRVQVLGEQFTWLRIAPPPGSFSFIDMTMVDKGAGDEGVVKGDKVNVYAGSSLSNKKREVQTQVEKGATVTIKGDQDGYYKILPPAGASLWVSSMYVEPATGEPRPRKPRRAASSAPTASSRPVESRRPPEAVAQRPPEPAAEAAATEPAPEPTGEAEPAGDVRKVRTADGTQMEVRTSEVSGAARLAPYLRGGGAYAEQLRQLEERLHQVLSAATVDRNELAALQAEYARIAAQDEEPVAKAIAEARGQQIATRVSLLSARDGILAERADLDQYRLKLGAERDEIERRLREGAAESAQEFRGELRSTLIFPPETSTYRLVDTAGRATIVAYVRIPAPLNRNIEKWLGQYVSVRAAKREYSPTGVPLIVASDITPVGARPASMPASQPAQ